MPARRFLVRGRVQGVGFRYFTLREAEALGLVGYVQNLPDGSVEAVAEGPEPALLQFEEQLRSGPGLARVSDVDVSAAVSPGERRFAIR